MTDAQITELEARVAALREGLKEDRELLGDVQQGQAEVREMVEEIRPHMAAHERLTDEAVEAERRDLGCGR